VSKIEVATRAETELLADAIVAEHQAAQRAWEDAVTHAIECGRLLLQAKESVGHGQWMKWLENHFPASVRTAQNYMRLARHEANAQAAAHLGVDGALRTLAPPKQFEPETDSADAGSDPDTTTPSRSATMTDIVRVVAKLGPQAARERLDEDWWRNRQFGSDRARLLEIGLIGALVDITPIVIATTSKSITWVWVGYLADDEFVYHPGWFSYCKKFAADDYQARVAEIDTVLQGQASDR